MEIYGRNLSLLLGSQVFSIISRFTCLLHFHLQSSAIPQIVSMTQKFSYFSTHSRATQHRSWYTQETLVLESERMMIETTCWLEEVGPPWIIAADWIAILGQLLSHLLVPWESGVWTPHSTSPHSGLAWTLFRWMLHMLSYVNRCPIMLHLRLLHKNKAQFESQL